jgi:hypothetical protein
MQALLEAVIVFLFGSMPSEARIRHRRFDDAVARAGGYKYLDPRYSYSLGGIFEADQDRNSNNS